MTPVSIDHLSEEALLDTRLCDLGLTISDSGLDKHVRQLFQELEGRQLKFRPACYLGDEWFSPNGVGAIAIPFYLAHPRLLQLEQKIMLEAEGHDETERMKLLRHECGHAITHAFNLIRRPKWREVFGDPDHPYEDYYHVRPYSKSYVRHLRNWYAQCHPEEDFAETFAVWLAPDSNWKQQYRDWPALKKLMYVDVLMRNLGSRTASAPSRLWTSRVDKLKRTLRMHYHKRRKTYAQEGEGYFDTDLLQIFSEKNDEATLPAAKFLRKHHNHILQAVGQWTHEKKFLVKQILSKLIKRCTLLNLHLDADSSSVLIHFISYITAVTSHYHYTHRYKGRK